MFVGVFSGWLRERGYALRLGTAAVDRSAPLNYLFAFDLRFCRVHCREYAYRSAPVSPRRTPSGNSVGSTGLSSNGDPFCATYRDNVVTAADGQPGGKLRLPPLMDDASAAMESQSQVNEKLVL